MKSVKGVILNIIENMFDKANILKVNILKGKVCIMSNHSGSYMLNDVLCVAKEMGILEAIGNEKTKEFVLRLLRIGRNYDCNDGEILDELEEFGICYGCLRDVGVDNLESGLCPKCNG